jgi:hypothetical protein
MPQKHKKSELRKEQASGVFTPLGSPIDSCRIRFTGNGLESIPQKNPAVFAPVSRATGEAGLGVSALLKTPMWSRRGAA